jgi:hypothetical protein
MFGVLGKIRRLRKLEVRPPDYRIPQTGQLKAGTVEGFPSLEDLRIIFERVDECSAFLRVFAKPAKLESLHITHHENLPFSTIVDSIRDSAKASTLSSLTLVSSDTEDGEDFDYDDPDIDYQQHDPRRVRVVDIKDLRKLFCFRGLKRLRIYEGGPRQSSTRLSNDEFSLLGRTWPEMEDLRLPTNDGIPTIGHEGLRQYLRANPRLRILRISIDASQLAAGVPIAANDSKSRSLLEELHLDETSIIPDLSAFALFLAVVAPNISSIRFYDHGESVYDGISHLQELEMFMRYYQLLEPLPSVAEPVVSPLHLMRHRKQPH